MSILPATAWRTAGQLRLASPHLSTLPRTLTQSHLPEISECPPATCRCASMPPGLDIKMDGPMTMPPYAQHIIVHTGNNDWPSKINKQEANDTTFSPARVLKELLGPRGKFQDAERPTLVTYSDQQSKYAGKTSAFVWPHNRVVHGIGNEQGDWEDFVSQQVAGPARGGGANLNSKSASNAFEISEVTKPSILVCGHGKRDERCGILGPLLLKDFRSYMKRDNDIHGEDFAETASISHIGGHAWAGNVIIYFPQRYKFPGIDLGNGESFHPLSQTGIWYGRVQPKHMEGIVEQTLKRGRVIKELLRGVHTPFEHEASNDKAR